MFNFLVRGTWWYRHCVKVALWHSLFSLIKASWFIHIIPYHYIRIIPNITVFVLNLVRNRSIQLFEIILNVFIEVVKPYWCFGEAFTNVVLPLFIFNSKIKLLDILVHPIVLINLRDRVYDGNQPPSICNNLLKHLLRSWEFLFIPSKESFLICIFDV